VLIHRSRQRGVSIIEVMIAVAVVGILMALAAPSATVWIQNGQLRTAAESISNGIQLARVEALKRNQLVAFQLTDAATTSWRVCAYDPVTDLCFTTIPDLAAKSASEGSPNAKAGVETVLSSTATAIPVGTALPGRVVFDSFGRQAATAPNNIVRVDVRNTTLSAADERRLVILVSVGGQVRMCDPRLVLANNPQGCA
jgi:type IV fimbrial biogenesis protein FimT